MNVALAHHWIASYRGGERVAEQIANLFPGSDLYTLMHDSNVTVPGLADCRILSSALNRVPAIRHLYRHLLPIHPLAIRAMRVPDSVDLLLSSDSSLIKGISLGPNTAHVCYCHSPPRYLWEMGDEYKRTSYAARLALDKVAARLRKFDRDSASNVDHFIANSNFVADRIRRYYNRDSDVIYPPVAVHEFRAKASRESFHLVVSELVPYKRVDLAVEAYTKLGVPLVVIGDGSERARLEKVAGPNIRFLGRQPFHVLREHFELAAAFVFPGIEDFGITPVEAQAAGCPVIAFRAGGALETVIEDQTGVFFDEQNCDALADRVSQFGRRTFSPQACRRNAEQFSEETFRQQYRDCLRNRLGISTSDRPSIPVAKRA